LAKPLGATRRKSLKFGFRRGFHPPKIKPGADSQSVAWIYDVSLVVTQVASRIFIIRRLIIEMLMAKNLLYQDISRRENERKVRIVEKYHSAIDKPFSKGWAA
jgi:hypothetical protein